MLFPMKPNKHPNQKEKNPYENANYPEFSEVHNYPDPYRHIGERINTNPNKYKKYDKPKEKKQQYPKMPQQRNQVKKVPVPVTKYVAVPVGAPMLVPVVTEKMVPVYPQNMMPVIPYNPVQRNSVVYQNQLIPETSQLRNVIGEELKNKIESVCKNGIYAGYL